MAVPYRTNIARVWPDGLEQPAQDLILDAGDTTPVPVRVMPARTGCPLPNGADVVCKMCGGPWASSSVTTALI